MAHPLRPKLFLISFSSFFWKFDKIVPLLLGILDSNFVVFHASFNFPQEFKILPTPQPNSQVTDMIFVLTLIHAFVIISLWYTSSEFISWRECIPVGCASYRSLQWPSISEGGSASGPVPLWTEFLTRACENITFPQLRTVMIGNEYRKVWAGLYWITKGVWPLCTRVALQTQTKDEPWMDGRY